MIQPNAGTIEPERITQASGDGAISKAVGRLPVMSSEMEIVEKARWGDVQAFEWLYEKHKNFVWNVAFRMTYQKESAEDLAQDVFLTAWRKLPDFQGKSSFSTWIYRITVNATLNWRRDSMRYASMPEDRSWEKEFASSANGPERAMMALDAEQTLRSLLGRLEKDRRLAFILREIEGLSYDEIAEATGWALGTVRSRLSRAREELSQLAEHMEK